MPCQRTQDPRRNVLDPKSADESWALCRSCGMIQGAWAVGRGLGGTGPQPQSGFTVHTEGAMRGVATSVNLQVLRQCGDATPFVNIHVL